MSPGFIFTSVEHVRVKCLSLQMVIFLTMCAGAWHTVPLACYIQMSNFVCRKCVLAGGKKWVMVMIIVCALMREPCCATWGICTPVEPLAKHTCTPPTPRAHAHTLTTPLQAHTLITVWNYITLILWMSHGPISDDISSGGPMLQGCRKWLAEEQTGRDSSEESLDRDSCYPGLSSTGESTPHTSTALFRQKTRREEAGGEQFDVW